MVALRTLKLVVVTPEKTLLDAHVESLRFPLPDGQIGVLPSHSPIIGRLGTGELEIRDERGTADYFVDGGFVQIANNVVTLLTDRCVPLTQLTVAEGEKILADALARTAKSDTEIDAKLRDEQRGRTIISLAKQA